MLYAIRRFFARSMYRIFSGPPMPDVFSMVHSAYLARAAYAATELNIPELLREQPRTIDELADELDAARKPLKQVLRLLASYRVFRIDDSGRYHLDRVGETLLEDHPNSMRHWVLCLGREMWDSHSQIVEAIKTGKPGFFLAHGERIWTWYPQNPEPHDTFIKAMNNFTKHHCDEIVQAFDFSQYGEIVDVGGGGGMLLATILKANPQVKGILFDQPRTVEEAKPRIQEAGLSDRCEVVGGSFFEKIPSGADAYIFKHVIRDWDDESVVNMFSCCNEAMRDDSTLLIIDAVVDPRNGVDKMVKLIDVQLMLDGGGGLRDRADIEQFFAASGFELQAIHYSTIIDAAVIVAKKVASVSPKEQPVAELASSH